MNVKVLKMKSMKRLIMVFVAVAGLALVAPGAQYEVDPEPQFCQVEWQEGDRRTLRDDWFEKRNTGGEKQHDFRRHHGDGYAGDRM